MAMRRNKLLYGLPIVVIGVVSFNLIFVVKQFASNDSRVDATGPHTSIVRDESDVTKQRPGNGPAHNINYRNETVSTKTNHMKLLHGISTSPYWTKPSENELEKALVLGSRRNLSGFLTIGIPTVQRETENYLSQTLDSLINKSSPKEQSDVIIVILLADFEEEKRSNLKKMIRDKYSSYLENGFMQVIQVPLSFYPPLENLKSNYKDSQTRVYWRSKQCVDFAFMFFYGSSLSEYYLQIEDDVYTVNGYLAAIRTYIREKRNIQWASLEFSTMGFIGKLFHSYDLDKLATLTMIFYEDQPVDWIFRYFKDLNAQHKNNVRYPSIFQHKGFQSSLKGKDTKNWVDKTFLDINDTIETDISTPDNPPGTVYSNIKAFEKYLPQLCYKNTTDFFWGKNPKKNDAVVLVFDKPTQISRLVIATGSSQHPADRLITATVELSTELIKSGSATALPKCSAFVEVGRFSDGRVEVDLRKTFPSIVACLRILVKDSQKQWAIIQHIRIWVPH
ncbi:alpha-1,6-mannosyl-glycoprotein 4-beta-N-acetylglucosaminyltransferase-like [Lytechinus pictus]|uniref:alpha-1,6-mannosyl-glycoprotein 4-beta-N-acetylglucosaminyltransferase-like n=1 Tax=Lytechinus pictus TaxID=7653 RepID=UPI0030B9B1F3